MKKIGLLLMLALVVQTVKAQNEIEAVKATCMTYIEGFYEGDTAKLKKVIVPKMYKIGFWKAEGKDKHEFESQMTYDQALNYANRVKARKQFAKPGSPKEVKVFEVSDHIASAKITAWWGIDYMLLSKESGTWMIEEVIWEGPLKKN